MRGKRKTKMDSRVQFREFGNMEARLHDMLRSLGEEEVTNSAIKLDQFERLRQEFIRKAAQLETSNNLITIESDKIQRAKLLYSISDSKLVLKNNLKQMTTIVMKLDQRVKREGAVSQQEKEKKGKGKYYEIEHEDAEEEGDKMTPLQKELQYKTLTLYTLQKNYFKLVQKESKEVEHTRRDVNNNKYNSLDQFFDKNKPIDRLLQKQHEETLEEKEILQALKRIDNMIEERMDKILDGIKLMNYNAVNISQGLDDVHKKILINLDKVQHNTDKLKENQKRMDEAAKVVTKPNCICNVIIAVLLGLIGYLVVKVVWIDE